MYNFSIHLYILRSSLVAKMPKETSFAFYKLNFKKNHQIVDNARMIAGGLIYVLYVDNHYSKLVLYLKMVFGNIKVIQTSAQTVQSENDAPPPKAV